MPRNDGTRPPYPNVDIKFRNGRIVRNTEPKLWRWKEWEHSPWEYDITDWQPARKE